MDVSSILQTAIFAALFIAVIALIVFIVELIKTVRSAHKFVDDTQKKLKPTLDHVETISNDLKPAVAKVDPLVDRLQLTVDAANVELMRVDKILEDVGDVTDTASNTAKTIDSVTSMPQKLVQDATTRVRGIVQGKHSSDEARRLADAKAEKDIKKSEEHDPAQKAVSQVKHGAAEIVNRLVKGNAAGEHASSGTQAQEKTAQKAQASASETNDAHSAYFTYGTQKENGDNSGKTPRHNAVAAPSVHENNNGTHIYGTPDASHNKTDTSSAAHAKGADTPKITNKYGVAPAPSTAPVKPSK